MTAEEGQNVTIWCEVKGEPMPNVTWLFNGQPIPTENEIGEEESDDDDGKLPNKKRSIRFEILSTFKCCQRSNISIKFSHSHLHLFIMDTLSNCLL